MSAGLLVGLGVVWPLAGFFICRYAGRRERDMVRVAGPGVIGISFLCFLAAAIVNGTSAGDHVLYHWILPSSGSGPTLAVPGVDFDLYLDPLAAVMTLVVTGVGFL